MPESAHCSEKDDEQSRRAAHLPKVAFSFDRVDDAAKIHAVVAGEERQREEDYSHDGENHDSFVLRVGNDGEFVLLDRAELEELVCVSE